MISNTSSFLAAIAIVAFAVAHGPVQASGMVSAPTACPADLFAKINSTNSMLVQAFHSKDALAAAKVFGVDGTYLVQDRPAVRGESALAAFFTEAMPHINSVVITTQECAYLQNTGAVIAAYELATFNVDVQGVGMTYQDSLVIWRQQEGQPATMHLAIELPTSQAAALRLSESSTSSPKSLRVPTEVAAELVDTSSVRVSADPALAAAIYHEELLWVQAYLSGKASNLSPLYTSDAVLKAEGIGAATGNSAIVSLFSDLMSGGVSAIKLFEVEVGIKNGEDLVYSYANYAAFDGSIQVSTGKYLAVWKKSTSGTYQIFRQYLNSDAPVHH